MSTHSFKTMTFISKKQGKLTPEENNEMKALKELMHIAPTTVHPDKMEKYTQYLVRSMRKMETVKKVA